ncbi:S41 family peptidase [Massilia sp. MS-15]|uniref:S41 family peptidase n=1 Tax=Massilia sp. MS-15 TaxID=2878200 RepID=UPI001CD5B46D|nr:S41 family peptidase [Massilia sp. MS-15]MCA1245965.1 S41 family peptidase [Massilia sp. MS-15]
MQRYFPRAVLLAASLLSCSILHAAAPAERDRVVDEVLARIKDEYVHPDRYPAIEANVRRHQRQGAYTAAPADEEFARLLTGHLQEITHDKHMSIRYQPNVRALRPTANASTAAKREQERRENYGLRKVEILPGNVGYLEIHHFHDDADLVEASYAAAMAFLAHTDALIIDLRANRGGGEAMLLLASYFFDRERALMELRYRGRPPMQASTRATVAGPRYLGKPVYVLTSNRTFSAGEAFSYSMRSLKRATLVGATTRGGGNPVTLQPLRDNYLLSVPIGESVSPVDGGGWEGKGVTPDLEVEDGRTLEVAHRQALERLRETARDEGQRASLAGQIEALGKS